MPKWTEGESYASDGGMLAATGVHPTMWVRLWFDNAGKPHQRAYTLVDPDPAAGTELGVPRQRLHALGYWRAS